MSAFRPKKRKVYTVKVPTESGAWPQITTRTKDGATARKMQRMVDELGPLGKRAWDVLVRVTGDESNAIPKTLELPQLYDLYVAADGELEALRASLDDVDLEPFVATWYAAASGPAAGISIDTADHYLSGVRSLIPEDVPFQRSALTPKRLREWIDDMTGVTPSTIRKRGQGMRAFTAWLVGRHVLAFDPMRDIKLPASGKPRVHYLNTAEAMRLADAQPSPFREFSALLAGSGIEVSVAVALHVRDVDVKHREIRAAGTKTHSRDRVVRVADWAWKYVAPLVKGRLPDAPLFEGIPDRWTPQQPHLDAIASLIEQGHGVYAGYTMRDQRHTYAVRAIRAGTPSELVARQLGHVNAVLVHSVYGRFSPSQPERDKWEKIAAAQDKQDKATATAAKRKLSIAGKNRQ